MSIYLGGNKTGDFYFGGTQIAKAYYGYVQVYPDIDWNPLNLPAYTMRFQFENSSFNPTTSGISWKEGTTWTRVSSSPNVWDYTNSGYTPGITPEYSWDIAFVNKLTQENLGGTCSILGANTSGIREWQQTFEGCDALVSMVPFDMSAGVGFNSTFNMCYNLASPIVANFSSARYLWNTFEATSIPSATIYNTSNCTDFSRMFASCGSLTSVNLFDTSSATDTSSMFIDCSSLTSVPLFDLSNVINARGMFAYCSSLTNVPLFDLSSVTNASSMFEDCEALIEVPLFDMPSVTNVEAMFDWCRYVESGALALYQRLSTQTNPPTAYTHCFTNCGSGTTTGAAELAQIPASWGGTGA